MSSPNGSDENPWFFGNELSIQDGDIICSDAVAKAESASSASLSNDGNGSGSDGDLTNDTPNTTEANGSPPGVHGDTSRFGKACSSSPPRDKCNASKLWPVDILGGRQCDELSGNTYIPSAGPPGGIPGQGPELYIPRTPGIIPNLANLSQILNAGLDGLSREDMVECWVDSIKHDRKTSGDHKEGPKNPGAQSPIGIRNEQKIQDPNTMKKQNALESPGAEHRKKSNDPDVPQDVDDTEDLSHDTKP